jgi:glycerol-3-phosphate dehydrogenase
MADSTFSALKRNDFKNRLATENYDVLIIGGGITGAGAALDATTRGLKTAMVEMKDFGWGTSSRSTKLIHGGLRYLKQFEIQLVREVGMERAVVHRNARHVVIAEKMILPIVEGGSLSKMMSSIALKVYDFLAGVESDERRVMLSKEETEDAEPLVRKDILKGGGLYYEYRSDDARLTIENTKTAVANGADCLNYIEVTGYIYENGKVVGVTAKDHISGDDFKIKAKKVINATGPWVDKLREKDTDKVSGKRLHLTKGVHLVVPREKLPVKQAVYFDVLEDGRMMFAIPRGRVTYIGTSDTNYEKDAKIERPITEASDVTYILKAVNYMFPSVNLEPNDVISTWAGLRPLIHEDGKDPSELSRKDEVFYSKTGLVSIAGGKLTGYRKMAERIIDVVLKQLKSEKPNEYNDIKKCQTATLQLMGGQFESQQAVEKFIVQRGGEVSQIGLKQSHVIDLVEKYGTETDKIIEKAFELYGRIKDAEKRLHVAELWYVINYEMTNNLDDYLIRRSGRLYFERDTLAQWYPFIADEMGKILDWSESDKYRYLADFKNEYEEVVAFKKEMSLV